VDEALVARIDAALPQTQCTRCGYPDCSSYARAIAASQAGIGQCPPGGAEGVRRLADLTGRPVVPLDPAHGAETIRRTAVIDEDWCIGCTLCIKACPVDCIVGASKRMHTVIEAWCTGCELCLPACPVDCISMEPTGSDATGWAAWSPQQADDARQRHRHRQQRLAAERQAQEARLAAKAAAKLADLAAASTLTDPEALERKRSVIEAALARARARKPAQHESS
jgi:electron transport complex protein RnfB